MSYDVDNTLNKRSRIVGALLASLCFVSIFAMLHHPNVTSEGVHEQIKEVLHEGKLNMVVHGVLVALIILVSACLTYYGKVRDLKKDSILFGLIVYWVGTIAMSLAALMSGIVGPELAGHYLNASVEQAEVYRGTAILASEINLAFAYFAVYCWCAGMLCLSLDMLCQRKAYQWFGIASVIASCAIALSLLIGWVSLSVLGMTIILVIISIWHLGIATSLYFGGYAK